MSLEDLTDSIVQLCQECNVWSSTINIPHGIDILDISAACGSHACTPKCAAIFPEQCPNGLHGSYYTFDPSVYGAAHSSISYIATPGGLMVVRGFRGSQTVVTPAQIRLSRNM